MGFPYDSDGKESACNAGEQNSFPGSGRSPRGGNGNPLQYSYLENPINRGAWWATDHGIAKSWTGLSNSRTHTHTHVHMHTHAHTHMCTHTHTCTHTQRRVYINPSLPTYCPLLICFLHLCLYICFVKKFVCTLCFLDSTYKGYHIIKFILLKYAVFVIIFGAFQYLLLIILIDYYWCFVALWCCISLYYTAMFHFILFPSLPSTPLPSPPFPTPHFPCPLSLKNPEILNLRGICEPPALGWVAYSSPPPPFIYSNHRAFTIYWCFLFSSHLLLEHAHLKAKECALFT